MIWSASERISFQDLIRAFTWREGICGYGYSKYSLTNLQNKKSEKIMEPQLFNKHNFVSQSF